MTSPGRSRDPRIFKHFTIQCLHCGTSANSLGDLKLHLTQECKNSQQPLLYCGCCSITYQNYHLLVSHLNVPNAHNRIPQPPSTSVRHVAHHDIPNPNTTPYIRVLTTTPDSRLSSQSTVTVIPPTQMINSPSSTTSTPVTLTSSTVATSDPLLPTSPLPQLSTSFSDLLQQVNILPPTPSVPTAGQRTPPATDLSDNTSSSDCTPLPSHLSLPPLPLQFQPLSTSTQHRVLPHDQMTAYLLQENAILRARSLALAHHSRWLANLLLDNLTDSPTISSSDRDSRALLARSPIWTQDHSDPQSLPLLDLLRLLLPIYLSVIFPQQ